MDIKIDGSKIRNKQELFAELKKQMKHFEFFGNNLDALYDVLTSINEEITVDIHNEAVLIEHLGQYYQSLLQVFNDCKHISIFKHTL
jgi:ribonuclease inhibitor